MKRPPRQWRAGRGQAPGGSRAQRYALGGFTAVVPEKVLAHPLAEYEICIAYRVGGFDFLDSTGKTAEVTG